MDEPSSQMENRHPGYSGLDPQAHTLLLRMTSSPAPSLNSVSIAQYRQAIAALRPLAGNAEPVGHVEDRIISGARGTIPIRLYTPTQGDVPLPVLVFFHGGGFVRGSLDSHDPLCRMLANRAGCLVVSVDYRLAPEHPYPAAIEDAYAATQWIGTVASSLEADATRIAVCGDSAGGTLAAAVTLLARDRQEPKLVYQALFYPVTDATMSSASYEAYAEGYLLTREASRWCFDKYIPVGVDPKTPYVSPLWEQDLSRLPPAFIIVAEYDPVRDDGEHYAEQLRSSGVYAECRRYTGMIHNFMLFAEVLDQGKNAIEEAGRALRSAFDEARGDTAGPL